MKKDNYPEEAKEILKELGININKAIKIKMMMETEGWGILSEILQKQADRYNNLKNLPIKTDDSPEKITNKVIEFKAMAVAFERLLNVSKGIVSIGEQSKDRLKEIKKELEDG